MHIFKKLKLEKAKWEKYIQAKIVVEMDGKEKGKASWSYQHHPTGLLCKVSQKNDTHKKSKFLSKDEF